MRRIGASVACVVAAGLVACTSSSDQPAEPSPAPSATATSPTTPSPSATPSPTSAPTPSPTSTGVDHLVVPRAAPAMPAPWRETFVIGYGRGPQLLGTSPGGDSGSLDIGPEYGAPGPDGSWWFLDAAKARVAHYDATGHYLGQVKVGPLLVGGRYFQWQLPHVLNDGTLVATRNSPTGTMIMRVHDDTADEIAVTGLTDGDFFAPLYDDGRLLYGYVRRGRMLAVDPATGATQPTDTFRTPSGTPFSLKVGGRLKLDLPDSGVSEALPLTTTSGARAMVGAEVRAGADGTLHVLLYGAGEDHPTQTLAGATHIDPTGAVAQVEPVTDPFSEADPGSPAHLAMAPGSSTPMLVYVLDDGVHVYERTG